jgi:hypothetical protein
LRQIKPISSSFTKSGHEPTYVSIFDLVQYKSSKSSSLYNELFVTAFVQQGDMLNPIALLQIAVSAQKLHIARCTSSTLAVRNDVIELQVGARATDTTLDTSPLIALPDSNTHVLWDIRRVDFVVVGGRVVTRRSCPFAALRASAHSAQDDMRGREGWQGSDG